MSVYLMLSCDGCDADPVLVGPLTKQHGVVADPEELTPARWTMFDPYTRCTYCPTCSAEIGLLATEAKLAETGP